MELADDSVDGVLCRWGYMLMPDPAAALAETRRVLRSGGRLAFAVWSSGARNPWISAAGRILVAHGHMPPPEPGEPGMFVLGDEELLGRLVENAGFANVRIEDVPVHNDYSSVDEYVRRSSEMGGMFSRAWAEAPEAGARAVEGRVSPGVCTVRRRRRLRAAGRLTLRCRELSGDELSTRPDEAAHQCRRHPACPLRPRRPQHLPSDRRGAHERPTLLDARHAGCRQARSDGSLRPTASETGSRMLGRQAGSSSAGQECPNGSTSQSWKRPRLGQCSEDYLRKYRLTGPFFDVKANAPLEAFIAEAPRHPVFRLRSRDRN